jgi:hypothetical protein
VFQVVSRLPGLRVRLNRLNRRLRRHLKLHALPNHPCRRHLLPWMENSNEAVWLIKENREKFENMRKKI